MNVRSLILLLLVTLLQGCRSCWIIDPTPTSKLETVTHFAVEFHQFYQPGSFSARIDGENVTAQFAPTPVPKGKSSMVRNASFLSGEVGATGVYVGVPQAAGESIAHLAVGGRQHSFAVSCKCIEGALCGYDDEIKFVPLNFAASPSPVSIPSGGAAVNMTLIADRPLTAPVAVTISPHLLGSVPGPANHIRVNGAAPGAATVVTLFPGGGPTNFYVQSVSPGGFWLRFETPGAQVGSVTGMAH